MQFHLTVAKATHNHLVETILATVITIFEPFIKKVLLSESGISLSIKNHTNLIQIIEQKNIIEAMNAVKKSLDEFMY